MTTKIEQPAITILPPDTPITITIQTFLIIDTIFISPFDGYGQSEHEISLIIDGYIF
jgi:hypothetical protein